MLFQCTELLHYIQTCTVQPSELDASFGAEAPPSTWRGPEPVSENETCSTLYMSPQNTGKNLPSSNMQKMRLIILLD